MIYQIICTLICSSGVPFQLAMTAFEYFVIRCLLDCDYGPLKARQKRHWHLSIAPSYDPWPFCCFFEASGVREKIASMSISSGDSPASPDLHPCQGYRTQRPQRCKRASTLKRIARMAGSSFCVEDFLTIAVCVYGTARGAGSRPFGPRRSTFSRASDQSADESLEILNMSITD